MISRALQLRAVVIVCCFGLISTALAQVDPFQYTPGMLPLPVPVVNTYCGTGALGFSGTVEVYTTFTAGNNVAITVANQDAWCTVTGLLGTTNTSGPVSFTAGSQQCGTSLMAYSIVVTSVLYTTVSSTVSEPSFVVSGYFSFSSRSSTLPFSVTGMALSRCGLPAISGEFCGQTNDNRNFIVASASLPNLLGIVVSSAINGLLCSSTGTFFVVDGSIRYLWTGTGSGCQGFSVLQFEQLSSTSLVITGTVRTELHTYTLSSSSCGAVPDGTYCGSTEGYSGFAVILGSSFLWVASPVGSVASGCSAAGTAFLVGSTLVTDVTEYNNCGGVILKHVAFAAGAVTVTADYGGATLVMGMTADSTSCSSVPPVSYCAQDVANNIVIGATVLPVDFVGLELRALLTGPLTPVGAPCKLTGKFLVAVDGNVVFTTFTTSSQCTGVLVSSVTYTSGALTISVSVNGTATTLSASDDGGSCGVLPTHQCGHMLGAYLFGSTTSLAYVLSNPNASAMSLSMLTTFGPSTFTTAACVISCSVMYAAGSAVICDGLSITGCGSSQDFSVTSFAVDAALNLYVNVLQSGGALSLSLQQSSCTLINPGRYCGITGGTQYVGTATISNSSFGTDEVFPQLSLLSTTPSSGTFASCQITTSSNFVFAVGSTVVGNFRVSSCQGMAAVTSVQYTSGALVFVVQPTNAGSNPFTWLLQNSSCVMPPNGTYCGLDGSGNLLNGGISLSYALATSTYTMTLFLSPATATSMAACSATYTGVIFVNTFSLHQAGGGSCGFGLISVGFDGANIFLNSSLMAQPAAALMSFSADACTIPQSQQYCGSFTNPTSAITYRTVMTVLNTSGSGQGATNQYTVSLAAIPNGVTTTCTLTVAAFLVAGGGVVVQSAMQSTCFALASNINQLIYSGNETGFVFNTSGVLSSLSPASCSTLGSQVACGVVSADGVHAMALYPNPLNAYRFNLYMSRARVSSFNYSLSYAGVSDGNLVLTQWGGLSSFVTLSYDGMRYTISGVTSGGLNISGTLSPSRCAFITAGSYCSASASTYQAAAYQSVTSNGLQGMFITYGTVVSTCSGVVNPYIVIDNEVLPSITGCYSSGAGSFVPLNASVISSSQLSFSFPVSIPGTSGTFPTSATAENATCLNIPTGTYCGKASGSIGAAMRITVNSTTRMMTIFVSNQYVEVCSVSTMYTASVVGGLYNISLATSGSCANFLTFTALYANVDPTTLAATSLGVAVEVLSGNLPPLSGTLTQGKCGTVPAGRYCASSQLVNSYMDVQASGTVQWYAAPVGSVVLQFPRTTTMYLIEGVLVTSTSINWAVGQFTAQQMQYEDESIYLMGISNSGAPFNIQLQSTSCSAPPEGLACGVTESCCATYTVPIRVQDAGTLITLWMATNTRLAMDADCRATIRGVVAVGRQIVAASVSSSCGTTLTLAALTYQSGIFVLSGAYNSVPFLQGSSTIGRCIALPANAGGSVSQAGLTASLAFSANNGADITVASWLLPTPCTIRGTYVVGFQTGNIFILNATVAASCTQNATLLFAQYDQTTGVTSMAMYLYNTIPLSFGYTGPAGTLPPAAATGDTPLSSATGMGIGAGVGAIAGFGVLSAVVLYALKSRGSTPASSASSSDALVARSTSAPPGAVAPPATDYGTSAQPTPRGQNLASDSYAVPMLQATEGV